MFLEFSGAFADVSVPALLMLSGAIFPDVLGLSDAPELVMLLHFSDGSAHLVVASGLLKSEFCSRIRLLSNTRCTGPHRKTAGALICARVAARIFHHARCARQGSQRPRFAFEIS